MSIVTNLDIDEFNKRFVATTHPCVIITKPNDPLVLTLNVLIKGDVPLIVDYNGSKVELMRMDCSAFNIAMLLDVIDDLVYIDADEHEHEIKTVRDYLEVFI